MLEEAPLRVSRYPHHRFHLWEAASQSNMLIQRTLSPKPPGCEETKGNNDKGSSSISAADSKEIPEGPNRVSQSWHYWHSGARSCFVVGLPLHAVGWPPTRRLHHSPLELWQPQCLQTQARYPLGSAAGPSGDSLVWTFQFQLRRYKKTSCGSW